MIVKRRTRGTNGIRPARLAEVSFRLHYAQTQRQSRCQIYTTTTWDYTTLKLFGAVNIRPVSFTTTLDYTTLKQLLEIARTDVVLLPLGITLLSNTTWYSIRPAGVLLPLGITLLSNYLRLSESVIPVLLALGITLLSNWVEDFELRAFVLLPLGITLLSNRSI